MEGLPVTSRTIKDLADEAYETSASKGFHDEPNPMPQRLMLIVTELAECMEADRNGEEPIWIDELKNGKPEGMAIEAADALIRIMDMFVEYGWDIDEALHLKMEFNKTREHKHGTKKY